VRRAIRGASADALREVADASLAMASAADVRAALAGLAER
jgi:hypothetical protein